MRLGKGPPRNRLKMRAVRHRLRAGDPRLNAGGAARVRQAGLFDRKPETAGRDTEPHRTTPEILVRNAQGRYGLKNGSDTSVPRKGRYRTIRFILIRQSCMLCSPLRVQV